MLAKRSISRRFSGGQVFQTVGQNIIQDGGTEGVSGAGGFDDTAQGAGGDEDGVGIAVEAVAALRSGGNVQHPDIGVGLLKQSRHPGRNSAPRS